MKITSKGQVTIPREIRERYGFRPGTEVAFEDVAGEVLLRKSTENGARGREIVEDMRGRATAGMSTDEILALTRGDA